MYVIKREDKDGYELYFSKYGLWGLQEYVSKAKIEDAMKFETKKEAKLYAKQMLNGKHKIDKIG